MIIAIWASLIFLFIGSGILLIVLFCRDYEIVKVFKDGFKEALKDTGFGVGKKSKK